MGKHSLLSDPRIESPPKRPKSAEGKTSANEQVSKKKKEKMKKKYFVFGD